VNLGAASFIDNYTIFWAAGQGMGLTPKRALGSGCCGSSRSTCLQGRAPGKARMPAGNGSKVG